MNTYKKLFKYTKDKRLNAYLSIIIASVSALLVVYSYYLIYEFLQAIIISMNYEEGKILSIKILVYLTTSAILYLVAGIFSHKFAFHLETNLRKQGIDCLTGASFRFFDLHSSGYIRKTIDNNASKTHTAVAHMLPDNSVAFLVPILSIILGFYISLRVGGVILVLTILNTMLLKSMMGSGEFMKLYQGALDKLSAETVEYVRGIQVVKIFGSNVQSFRALSKAISDYAKYAYNYSLSCKKPYVIYQLIFLAIIPIITIPLIFIETQLDTKLLAVELVMIFLLSGVMMVSFMKIMWATMHIFNANYALNQLEKLFQAMEQEQLTYGTQETFVNYNIEFDNVSFSYGNTKVLKNLSFSLEEKKTYALVGHSGSGKSTIVKLLSGFYGTDQGNIKIGGKPLMTYTKEAIIKNIAFVFQGSKVFHTSLYENVHLAKKTATRTEVLEALSLAGCDDIIEKFQDKENTIIGTKGVYLSGGEIQRIAIARAILKNAPIVIMDEASAGIDADNEYKLQQAFKNLMKNKTVIMIAHRLSSIQNVDEILVLEKGKIVQRGKHQDLLNTQGQYKKLFELYQNANEWRVSHV